MTALFLDARNAMVDKYVHACLFEINCLNEGEHNEQCKIEDVEVLYFKGDKPSKNLVFSEETAIGVYEAAGEHMINSAYATAQNNAYIAATTSSSGYSGGTATNNVNVSNSSTQSSYTSASAAGAMLAANNSGDVAGAVGVAGASAYTTSSGYGNTNANQTVRTSNVTSQTATDGYTQYQVYQKEKQVAEETQKQVQQEVRNLMNKAGYSQFTVQSGDIASKEIMAEIGKKYDRVQLTFKLNGVRYTASWNVDEIDK